MGVAPVQGAGAARGEPGAALPRLRVRLRVPDQAMVAGGDPPAGGLRWLDDIRAGDRAEVGGKAFVLAVLRQAGLPVPNGFVVTLSFGDAVALAAALSNLPGPLAVRSSAAAEDGAEASFAGQFRTELGVSGHAAVAAAIDRCRSVTGAARG